MEVPSSESSEYSVLGDDDNPDAPDLIQKASPHETSHGSSAWQAEGLAALCQDGYEDEYVPDWTDINEPTRHSPQFGAQVAKPMGFHNFNCQCQLPLPSQ